MGEVVDLPGPRSVTVSEAVVYVCDCGNMQFLMLEDGAILCPVCRSVLQNLRMSVEPPELPPAA